MPSVRSEQRAKHTKGEGRRAGSDHDELATSIHALRDRLPDLLSSVLEPSTGQTSQALKAAATHPVYRQMMDFLASSPTPRQIIDFQIPTAGNERLNELLENNREGGLTDAASAELESYELVHLSMIRLNARARQ